ncbi:sucrase-isomaltase, intestinal-like [Anolis carolinensis]|uniref:sucrase-isomaltase, intestinal-like n=1 Tax=Anolis carolinensis TaxID=28377 RepID=UPI002F2B8763
MCLGYIYAVMKEKKILHFLALAVLVQACIASSDGQYGYSLTGQPEKTAKGWRLSLSRHGPASRYGNDIFYVEMHVEYQTQDRLRFKIFDPNNIRFEVPLKIESPSVMAADTNYDIEFVNDESTRFKIIRKATGTVLWETSLANLVFSDQYLQIATNVPSTSVYGFGEHQHPSFKHNMNDITYGMYSRDQSPKVSQFILSSYNFPKTNLYSFDFLLYVVTRVV